MSLCINRLCDLLMGTSCKVFLPLHLPCIFRQFCCKIKIRRIMPVPLIQNDSIRLFQPETDILVFHKTAVIF